MVWLHTQFLPAPNILSCNAKVFWIFETTNHKANIVIRCHQGLFQVHIPISRFPKVLDLPYREPQQHISFCSESTLALIPQSGLDRGVFFQIFGNFSGQAAIKELVMCIRCLHKVPVREQ